MSRMRLSAKSAGSREPMNSARTRATAAYQKRSWLAFGFCAADRTNRSQPCTCSAPAPQKDPSGNPFTVAATSSWENDMPLAATQTGWTGVRSQELPDGDVTMPATTDDTPRRAGTRHVTLSQRWVFTFFGQAAPAARATPVQGQGGNRQKGDDECKRQQGAKEGRARLQRRPAAQAAGAGQR